MNKQKNENRRQHYVPKFYLRNFSKNSKSVGLYRFKESKMIIDGSINDNLWKEYFYGDDAIVENELAKYEKKWNDIISTIIKTESISDTDSDQIWLRYFMLISSARTLKRGNQLNNDYTALIKKILEVEDPEFYERVMNAGERGLSVKFKYPTLKFMDIAQRFLPLVIDLNVDLLINRSHIDYVTSDNPVVFCNQLFQEKNLSRGFGWGEYGIQFIVPVSPKIAICMYDGEVYDIKEKFLNSSSIINKLNELFLDNSDDVLVFANGGNDKARKEKMSYIEELVKRKACHFVQDEDNGVMVFSNKQIYGSYDLSNIFTIKQKYKDIYISSHSEEEINEKINTEEEKILRKLEKMTEEERESLLSQKKAELITVSFNDMERTWVKIYNKHQAEIMTLLNIDKTIHKM